MGDFLIALGKFGMCCVIVVAVLLLLIVVAAVMNRGG